MKRGITFGAFDLFHAGHVLMLKEAKSICDYLIVCIQSDPSVDRAKKNKPIQSVIEREIQVSACTYVDEVIIYDLEEDVLKIIEKDNLIEGHHLYITFNTENKKVILPKWLKKKYPEEMTIVIQYEFWNLKVFEDRFEILLSFNDLKVNLSIPFISIISFADPFANFGLKIIDENNLTTLRQKKEKRNNKINKKKDNVIDFTKFKKSN